MRDRRCWAMRGTATGRNYPSVVYAAGNWDQEGTKNWRLRMLVRVMSLSIAVGTGRLEAEYESSSCLKVSLDRSVEMSSQVVGIASNRHPRADVEVHAGPAVPS